MRKTTDSLAITLAAAALFAASTAPTLAASGAWTNDASSVWSAATNWNPNAVPGTLAGDVVSLTNNISAARTVTLDTAATLGTLNIGDSGSSYFGFTLTPATSQTLTFNNNGSGAKLVQQITTASDVINTPIVLSDNLTISNTSTLTLGGIISGTGYGTTTIGGGTLNLTNGNTFDGGLTVSNGTVNLNSNSIAGAGAAGTGTLILAGGLIQNTSAGAVTISNNVVAQAGTSSTIRINGQDINYYGNISGSGNLTGAYTGSGTHQISLNGDNSGFTGTCTVNNASAMRFRFNSVNAGSSNAAWVLNNNNTDGQSLGFGNGTIYFGSLAGAGQFRQDFGGATPVLVVGGLNTDATFSGRILLGSSCHAAVTKVGTGAWTLTGANGYDSITTVENGTLVAGVSGAFGGAASAIALGDATAVTSTTAMNPRLFNGAAITMNRAVTVGTTDTLGNGSTTFTLGGNTANSSTFSGGISLNQSLVVTQAASGTLTLSGGITNATGSALTVTFNNTGPITSSLATIDDGFSGGSVALTENGPSTLTLSAANTYTGNTTVSGGTLVVNGATASGSAASVTGSGSVLGGSGTVGGNTTISGGATLTPRAGAGSATTTTFGGNLTLSSASANFTVGTTGGSGNDQVIYGSSGSGTLTLNSSDTINITTSGGLDIAADYVLFANASGGTVSMATTPTLKTNGVTAAPGPGSFIITNYPGSSSVVLHYVPFSTAPMVNSQSASPASLGHHQITTVTVNVTPASGKNVTNLSVTVDGLSGAGDPVKLTGPGGNGNGNWAGTFTAAGSIVAHTYTIGGFVQQNDGSTAGWSVNVTVTNYNEVWSGLGANNKWSTAGNWSASYAPGAGDAVAMDGATQITNNLDFSLSVGSLTFNSGAGSFDITNAATALTLSGGLTNNSSSAQTLDVPVALSGSPTFDAESGNVTVNGAITGGALTTTGPNTVKLAGNNSYTGGTTISAGTLVVSGNNTAAAGVTTVSGTLQLQNTNAIAGSALTLNGNSTLILQADADATFTNAGMAAFSPGNVYNLQVNSLNSPAGDGHTLTLLGQSGAGANTDTTINISSANGDTLSFGPSAYALSGNSGSAFGGNNNNFNLTGANVILNGLNDAAGNGDVVLVLAGAYGNEALTINGTVTYNVGRTIGAIVNSGILTLNNTVSGPGGANWGFWATLNSGTLNLNNGGAINNNNTLVHGNPAFYINGGNLGNSSGAAVTLSVNPTIGFYGDFTFVGTNDLNLGTGAVTLNSSRTVTVNTNTLTLAGGIGDNNAGYSLTVAGAGTLALTASNSYTGGTYVNGGTLALNSALTGTTATGALTVNDGGTLQVSAAGASQLTPSTLTLGSASGATNAFLGVANTSVAQIHATNLVLYGATAITIRSGAFQKGQTYPLIAYDTPESGGGSVVLGSLPPLVQGYLTDNGSLISLTVTNVTSEIWSGAANGTWNSVSLDWKTNGINGIYIDGAAVVFNETATGTTSITNIPAVVSPFSMTVSNSSKPYSFAGGAIGGSASLTKDGSSTLTLANTNTYTGGTTVSAGTLQLGDGSAKNGVVAGDIADNASLVFANPVDQTFAGAISGTGSLSKTGNGTLTLAGANSFSGLTTIKQGAVSFSAVNNLSTNTVVLGDAGAGANATLQLTGAINVSNNVTVAAGAGARTLSAVGGSTFSGALTLNNNLTVIETGTGDSHLSGAFTGAGNLTVSNTTANILWLDGASSPNWTGAFIIQAGTVRPGTLGAQFNTNTVLSISASNAAFLNVGGIDADLFFAGVNDIPGATGGGFGGGSNTRNVVLGGSGNYTCSGTYSSSLWGLSVNLGGSARQTLTGTNTYVGATTVTSGTLLVNGSIASPVSVNGGAFGGTGTVSNSVTVNSGGSLVPGASGSGALTVNNNLTLNSGSTSTFAVNGTTLANTAVAVGGSATYGGVLNIVPAGTFTAGQNFTLFSGTGAAGPSNFGSLTGSPGGGLAFSFTNGVLSVVSAGPSGSNRLTNSITGGGATLQLSWGNGWTLQRQTNSPGKGLGTNWQTYVAGGAGITSTNISLDKTKGSVFFRLVYP
jgi:autotransporter-associated beta strand protein